MVTLDPAPASLGLHWVPRNPWPAHLSGASLSLSVTSLGSLWNQVVNTVSQWVPSHRTNASVEKHKIYKHFSQERIMVPREKLTLIFTFRN